MLLFWKADDGIWRLAQTKNPWYREEARRSGMWNSKAKVFSKNPSCSADALCLPIMPCSSEIFDTSIWAGHSSLKEKSQSSKTRFSKRLITCAFSASNAGIGSCEDNSANTKSKALLMRAILATSLAVADLRRPGGALRKSSTSLLEALITDSSVLRMLTLQSSPTSSGWKPTRSASAAKAACVTGPFTMPNSATALPKMERHSKGRWCTKFTRAPDSEAPSPHTLLGPLLSKFATIALSFSPCFRRRESWWRALKQFGFARVITVPIVRS